MNRVPKGWAAVLAGLLGLMVYLVLRPGSGPANATLPPEGKRPQIVRTDSEYVLPDGSPYRDRLAVAQVELRETRQTRAFPAVVEVDPTQTTNILPPVTGRIVGLDVQLSDAVKQGQVLVRLQSADLAQAQSDLEKARASVEVTRRAFERNRDLSKAGAGAVKDYEQAASDFAQATSEFNRATQRLQVIGSRGQIVGQQGVNVVAPFDGAVTALSVGKGAVINDATASLMTISNLDKVFVTANAPEKDIGFIRVGDVADIRMLAYPGERFSGSISALPVFLEPDTRRVKLRIVFDNPSGRLLPNMFGTVAVSAPPVRQLVAPTSALVLNNDNVFVFVEKAPWTFERRLVEVDADDGHSAVVRKGLSAGERIVTKGGVLLDD